MSAIYLDTSAALKQLVLEQFSSELVEYLVRSAGAGLAITSSVLLDVELSRVAVREGLDPGEHVAPVLGPVSRRQITRRVVAAASAIPFHVRSLDAIHLATAAALGTDLVAVVTYDKQMLRAAELLGLPTASPGWTPATGPSA